MSLYYEKQIRDLKLISKDENDFIKRLATVMQLKQDKIDSLENEPNSMEWLKHVYNKIK